MSSKYKFLNRDSIYFVTATIVDWVDVFTRDVYRDVLMDSIRFCQQNQGLKVYAWVLMTNHFHLICSTTDEKGIGMVLRNIKSFTAMKLIDAIIKSPASPRQTRYGLCCCRIACGVWPSLQLNKTISPHILHLYTRHACTSNQSHAH